MSEAVKQSDLREGYKQVQFGPKTLVVPNEWSAERFGDVFQRRRESIDEIDDETVKYVGLKHIDSGQLDINGYDVDGRERSSSRVFREGDVLFGKLRPNLNKAAIAPFSGVCSSDILPIYAKEDAHQQYLPYLMHSNLVRDRVVSTMEGTNLPRTSWGDLEKTLVPLPSLPEQHRIADILSTVDEQIQQTDEMIEKAEDLKRGLMQDLITGGFEHTSYKRVQLGPREVDIPETWGVERMKDVAEIVSGGTPKKSTKEYWGGDIVWVTPTDVTGTEGMYISDSAEKITEEGLANTSTHLLEPGTVLMTSRATIGEAVINTVPATTNQGFKSLVPEERMHNEYLYYYVRTIADYLTEIGGGSTFPEINKTDTENIRVPVPPLDEQERIANIINQADKKRLEEQEYKQNLQELKRGLMQDLLTGTVRVDPEQAN